MPPDVSDLGPLLPLTGALIRGDLARFEEELARRPEDFLPWVSGTVSHRLASTAFALLPAHPEGPWVARAREALRPHYQGSWGRNQRLHHRTLELVRTLASHGVDATVLKGTPLALRLYGNAAARSTGDVDLLVVGEEQLGSLLDALSSLGFRGRDRPRVSLATAQRYCHHVALVGPGLLVEAHWDLRRHATFAVDLERLLSTRTRIGAGSRSVPALSDEYELVLLLLSVHDDAGRAELGFRTLVDIAVLCQRVEAQDAWGAFLEQRRREGLLRLSVNVLDLAVGLLGQEGVLPRLAAALDAHAALLVRRAERARLELFRRGRRAWVRNRLWAFSIEESSFAASLSWWAISLPVRLDVYRLPG